MIHISARQLKSCVVASFFTISRFLATKLKPSGRGCAESLRRATGAPPDTQIPIRLRRISMCEENMQKLVKVAKMLNPRGGEARDAGETVPVGAMRFAR